MTVVTSHDPDKGDSVDTADVSLSGKLPQRFPVSVIMQSQPSSHRWAKETWDAVGVVSLESENTQKEAVKEEQVTIDFAFPTVVTIKPIKKGEKLTKENIWVKRPGIGPIKAEHYNELLGKIVNKDIDYDEYVDWSDINE